MVTRNALECPEVFYNQLLILPQKVIPLTCILRFLAPILNTLKLELVLGFGIPIYPSLYFPFFFYIRLYPSKIYQQTV